MKKNNRYIVIILLCLVFNILGNFTCLCNKSLDDEATSTTSEETKSTTSNSSGDGGTPSSANAGNSSGDGGTPTSAEDDATRFREKLKESYSKFIAEQAAKELKAEEDRQANFQKDREEWKKLCKDELISGISHRNKVKRGEKRGDIKLITLYRADINDDIVKIYRRELDEFRDELAGNNKHGLTNEQKDDIITKFRAIDNLSRELQETKENLTYLLAHPDPDITCATPERLQLAEKLVEDLQQQKEDLVQMVSGQGDNIANYVTPPKPEAPTETVEDTQANKALILAISDPGDATKLVTAIAQQMEQMIAEHVPVFTPKYTFKIAESVKVQAEELAKQAYELRSILLAIEDIIQDTYFGESMNDYIDRSTEEGAEKIKRIQEATYQLEEIYELFKARFHVGGYSPGIVTPPRLTKSYINSLVNALVDQMVPGSELTKGPPTPTTAEAWADLALSEGLEILQQTDTTNRFKDARGVWPLIKPIGSTRYNMLKERIIEVYRQRAK